MVPLWMLLARTSPPSSVPLHGASTGMCGPLPSRFTRTSVPTPIGLTEPAIANSSALVPNLPAMPTSVATSGICYSPHGTLTSGWPKNTGVKKLHSTPLPRDEIPVTDNGITTVVDADCGRPHPPAGSSN